MSPASEQLGGPSAAAEWEAYGRAVLHSMAEVLEEAPEDARHLLLETADYWLSLGVAIGTRDPQDAARLLELIEAEEHERSELQKDAEAFIREVLG